MERDNGHEQHLNAKLEALAGEDDPAARAQVLWRLGHLARTDQRPAEATQLFAQAADELRLALASAQAAGDAQGAANHWRRLGDLTQLQGDVEAARAAFAQSLAFAEQIGDVTAMVLALRRLSNLAREAGLLQKARDLFHRSDELLAFTEGEDGLQSGNAEAVARVIRPTIGETSWPSAPETDLEALAAELVGPLPSTPTPDDLANPSQRSEASTEGPPPEAVIPPATQYWLAVDDGEGDIWKKALHAEPVPWPVKPSLHATDPMPRLGDVVLAFERNSQSLIGWLHVAGQPLPRDGGSGQSLTCWLGEGHRIDHPLHQDLLSVACPDLALPTGGGFNAELLPVTPDQWTRIRAHLVLFHPSWPTERWPEPGRPPHHRLVIESIEKHARAMAGARMDTVIWLRNEGNQSWEAGQPLEVYCSWHLEGREDLGPLHTWMLTKTLRSPIPPGERLRLHFVEPSVKKAGTFAVHWDLQGPGTDAPAWAGITVMVEVTQLGGPRSKGKGDTASVKEGPEDLSAAAQVARWEAQGLTDGRPLMPEARAALMQSSTEREQLGHHFLGTEHLLLALLSDGGPAGQALNLTNLRLSTTRVAVEEFIEPDDTRLLQPNDKPSVDYRRALRYAAREARELGDEQIGTAHLLLGILRDTQSPALDVLVRLEVSRDDLYRALLDIRKKAPFAPPSKARSHHTPTPTQEAAPIPWRTVEDVDVDLAPQQSDLPASDDRQRQRGAPSHQEEQTHEDDLMTDDAAARSFDSSKSPTPLQDRAIAIERAWVEAMEPSGLTEEETAFQQDQTSEADRASFESPDDAEPAVAEELPQGQPVEVNVDFQRTTDVDLQEVLERADEERRSEEKGAATEVREHGWILSVSPVESQGAASEVQSPEAAEAIIGHATAGGEVETSTDSKTDVIEAEAHPQDEVRAALLDAPTAQEVQAAPPAASTLPDTEVEAFSQSEIERSQPAEPPAPRATDPPSIVESYLPPSWATTSDVWGLPNARPDDTVQWKEGPSLFSLVEAPDASKIPARRARERGKERLRIRAQDVHTNLLLPEGVMEQAVAALSAGQHIIFVGPPATGKTTLAHDLCLHAVGAGLAAGFALVTADPGWTPDDTIGRYEVIEGKETFAPGLFTDAIESNRWLFVDEINRIDVDETFGPLLTVLSGRPVQLPYRREGLPLRLVPPGVAVEERFAEVTMQPSWRILGTMNVAEREGFEMSRAFRRRFAFIDLGVPAPQAYRQLLHRFMTEADWQAAETVTGTLLRLFDADVDDNPLMRWGMLGPGIAEDMIYYLGARGSASDLTHKHLAEAVLQYVLPQFEGQPPDRIVAVYQFLAYHFSGTERKKLRTRLRMFHPDLDADLS